MVTATLALDYDIAILCLALLLSGIIIPNGYNSTCAAGAPDWV